MQPKKDFENNIEIECISEAMFSIIDHQCLYGVNYLSISAIFCVSIAIASLDIMKNDFYMFEFVKVNVSIIESGLKQVSILRCSNHRIIIFAYILQKNFI